MLVIDVLRLSTRMFRTNKSRTLLTILGIGVGIGAILFLVSLGYGLQKLIENRITTSDTILSLDVSTGDIEELKLTDKSIEDIKTVYGVERISPLITAQSQVTIDDISTELQLHFADSNFFKLDGTTLESGEFYGDNEEDKIIISSITLQLFNIEKEDAIGREVEFTIFSQGGEETEGIARSFVKPDKKYKIVGIVEEEASNYIYMPFSNSSLLKDITYSKLKVKVDMEENLDIARDGIMEKGFTVSALSDIIEQAKQVFRVLQIVLASFGIVALIVSAIGMFNTMTIALLERTQEVGIMKALGATSGDIWAMFLSESVIIGFLGGTSGIIIGFGGGEVFNYGVNLLASRMGGEGVDLFYSPYWFVVSVISFSTVVGLATGFYPAKRAAKINPLEALRYK